MFILFTPFSFLFFSFYLMLIACLFTIPNFYMFWIYIEIAMLVFIGLSYTIFLNRFSPLIVYFLIQAFASFRLLISYCWSSTLIFTIFIIFKLGIFPFHTWFLNAMYRFPNFILLLSATLQKLPVFILIQVFNIYIERNIMWFGIIRSTVVAGILILITSDIRIIILSSSIGNNSWLMLSYFVNIQTFLIFFLTYSIFIALIMSNIHYFSKPISLGLKTQSLFIFVVLIISVSGLPPFPFFFAKIYVLAQYFYSFTDWSLLIIIFLISNSFMIAGYFKSVTKFYIHSYSSPSVFIHIL